VKAFIKIDIKKVWFFDVDRCNAGMFYEVSIEGGSSSFLCSDDDKVWHHPYRVGACSKRFVKNIFVDCSHGFYQAPLYAGFAKIPVFECRHAFFPLPLMIITGLA